MNVNWQIVILDAWILVALVLIVAWFAGDLRRRSMLWLSAGFVIIGLGFLVTAIGDVLLAIGFTHRDHWLLRRDFRPLPLRIGLGVGLTTIAAKLRFGHFNGQRR